MKYYDVFNGDADGICALHQLRLAKPLESTLVTGVKRDIALLKNIQVEASDTIMVLDISFDKNRDDALRLLAQGANITYFDHHFAGEIPEHKNLTTNIDTSANTCTSLLVNASLKGKYLPWAVTAAFGDNLFSAAETAAIPLQLNTTQLEQLKLLGTCINYNGYGASLDDLIFPPAELYQHIKPYENPFDFIEKSSAYKKLVKSYQDDFAKVAALQVAFEDKAHALYILPNEKWARRVSGIYANDLAQQSPDKAHAILTEKDNGNYLVSVRAPLNNKTGADVLCRQFETGGGRQAAAGINDLPVADYEKFLSIFKSSFE